jgi:hypothetical protein
MCWTSEVLKEENSGESKIPIIKVLRMYVDSKGLAAYYRATPYVLYREYNSSILPRLIDSCFEINEGLHCYSDSCKCCKSVDTVIVCLNNGCAVTYNKGHRIRFEDMQPFIPVIVKGYIPSNTRFYINDLGEIVTQRLILTNVLVQ